MPLTQDEPVQQPVQHWPARHVDPAGQTDTQVVKLSQHPVKQKPAQHGCPGEPHATHTPMSQVRAAPHETTHCPVVGSQQKVGT